MKNIIKSIFIILTCCFTALLWPLLRANFYEMSSAWQIVLNAAIMGVINIVTVILVLKFAENYNYFKKYSDEYNRRGIKKIAIKFGVFATIFLVFSIASISKFTYTFATVKHEKDKAVYEAEHNYCPLNHARLSGDECPVCGLSGYALYISKQYREFLNDYKVDNINFTTGENCKNRHLLMNEDLCPRCGQEKSEVIDFIINSYICTRCGNRCFNKFDEDCRGCGGRIEVTTKRVEKAAEDFDPTEKAWSGRVQSGGKYHDFLWVRFCGNYFYFAKDEYKSAERRKTYRNVLDIMTYLLSENIYFDRNTNLSFYIAGDNLVEAEESKIFLNDFEIDTKEEVSVIVEGIYGDAKSESEKTLLAQDLFEHVISKKD